MLPPSVSAGLSLNLPDPLLRRVRMTIGCGDCEAIPKVPGAGETFDSPDGRYQLMHNGVKVIEGCYYGQWTTELIRLLRGHHEPQEEKAFHAILQHIGDGGTMVELGSFWAYYSLWFHKAVRRATTYLVEPDPNNLEVGRRNFALNGMTGQFFQAAMGRAPRPPAPFLCADSDKVERLVPTLSLDELVRQEGINSLDLLLADIQGAELEMLEGAARSISRGVIRFVVVSTHYHEYSRDPHTHQKCLDFLRDRHAHIVVEHSVAESYSGDGLIVAALRPEDRGIPPVEVSRNHPANSLFGELEHALAAARHGLEAELGKANDLANHLGQALASTSERLASTFERLASTGERLAEVHGQFVALRNHPVIRALRAIRHPLRAAKRLWPAA